MTITTTTDDDLIRRGDALEAVTHTAVKWGFTGEPAILIDTKDAIRALAVQPAPVDATQAHFRADMARRLADAGVTQAHLDLAAEVLGQPAPVAEPTDGMRSQLVRWLRNPWLKCDGVARGPIPEWALGLMHEAANAIEAEPDYAARIISAVTARPVAEVQAEARNGALREAMTAVSRAAWKHNGDDSYSAGLEHGARKQNDADFAAIAALIPAA